MSNKTNLIFLATFLIILCSSSVFAASEGPNTADSAATQDDSDVATPAWSSASSATISDDSRATVPLDKDVTSEFIHITDFDFVIPSTAIIDGILVSIERHRETGTGGLSGGPITDEVVNLIKAGSTVGSDLGTVTAWPVSDLAEDHGSSSDLWGTSWTPAEINDPDFGVAISAKRSGGSPSTSPEARIDSVSVTVTYHGDVTPPVVTVPADITEEATGPSGAPVSFSASALDDVDGALTPTCTPDSGDTFPLGTTTIDCEATDAAGNVGSDSFDVTVEDTTPPAAPSVSDVTLEATGPSGASYSYSFFADDLVDGALLMSCAPPSPGTFPLGITTVSCSATDSSGNIGSMDFDIVVEDTTVPVVAVPADITEEAISSSGATVIFAVSADDLVDGAIAPVCDASSGDTFPLGTTTVTCDATDSSGNTGSDSFDVTVEDTTAPALVLPADMIVEAMFAGGAIVDYFPLVSATDLVDPSPSLFCAPPGGPFPMGPTIISCSAGDDSGNVAMDTFDITVVDTTPPVLSGMPGDDTIEATSSSGAVYVYSDPTATDIADPSPSVGCVPASGSTFPLGITTVTCTATDASANSDSDTFDVTVEDTAVPVVTVPADITEEATSPSGASVSFVVTADDVIDGPLTPSCDYASGDTFPLGTTTVTCDATDSSGNTDSDSFDVTVEDTTPPSFSGVPSDITVEADSPAGAVVIFTDPTADDLVDGSVAVACLPSSGSTFPLGTTTVTCSASDLSSNSDSAGFDVTVVDTTDPVVTVPADITEEATSSSGASVSFSVSADDIVDGAIAPSCDYSSGDTFPIGTTTVTCDATDAASNTGSNSFDVTVVDTTGPVIDAHSDEFAEATSGAGAVVAYSSPATSDAVDGPGVASCLPVSGSTFVLGATTVTCTASDVALNAATPTTFDVTVSDTTPPVIALLGSVSVSVTLGGSYVDAGATALDGFDGDITSSISVVNPVSTSVLGVYTVTYDVSDISGNDAVQVTRTVTVVSPPAPSGGGGGGSSGGSSNNYQPYGTRLITTSAGVVPSIAPSTVPPPLAKSNVVPEATPVPQIIPPVPPLVPDALTPQATGVFNLNSNIGWFSLLIFLLLLAVAYWSFRKK